MSSNYHEAIWQDVPANAPLPSETERRALVTSAVGPGIAVLDLGCGDGRFACAMQEAGASVTAVDVSSEALRRARQACPGLTCRLVAPGEALPLETGSVDLVVAMEVVNQVVDVALFLSEAHRVLRARGRMIVTVPSFTGINAAWLALRDFDRSFSIHEPEIRFFTRSSLENAMRDAGFRVDRLERIGGGRGFRRSLLCVASVGGR